jgi:hypothetical protein
MRHNGRDTRREGNFKCTATEGISEEKKPKFASTLGIF